MINHTVTRISTILVVFFTFFFLCSSITNAQTPPQFPTCVNPQGQLIVKYSSGSHGIPGNPATYNGTDEVYQVSVDSVMQCLCLVDGRGTQTNWWKIAALSKEQIDSLTSQGWIFIPDGTSWGLDASAYLAKNIPYSCLPQNSGGGGGSVSGASSGGGVLGEVLGLAFTGNIMFVNMIAALGIISLAIGIAVKILRMNES